MSFPRLPLLFTLILLISPPVQAEDSPSRWLAVGLSAYMTAQAADLAVLRHCTGQLGSCEELNPLLRGLQGKPAAQGAVKLDSHSRWLAVSLTAYMTAQAADLAVLRRCGQVGCEELNPLLRGLQDKPVAQGAMKLGIAAAQSYVLWKVRKRHPKLALTLSLVGTAVFTGLAIRSAQQLPDRR